jgi:REP element-mobilizing transposase RayT
MSFPERQTSRLRWGRISLTSVSYFVTICTKNREPAFADCSMAAKVVDVVRRIHDERDAEILAATVMPDHVHFLFTLGTRLSLGQVIAKFKALSRDHGRAPWRWQDDGFEHRLRSQESVEDYAFYIFMNPYRAKLIPVTERWPAWFCPEPKRFLFLEHFRTNEPVPVEWLGKVEEITSRITIRSPITGLRT